jgi:signal transduction histidine kinase
MNSGGGNFEFSWVSGDAQRAERVLATARSFLAFGVVIALYFDPAIPRAYHPLAYLCSVCYLIYSVLVLILVHSQRGSAPGFVLAIHLVDILWAGAVAMLTPGPSVLPWVLFLFALLGAAYRWGLRETLATAGGTSAVLLAGIVGLRFVSGWPAAELEYRSEHAITTVLCLLMVGGVFGYLADKEKQLRAQTVTIDRLVARASPEIDIRETLEEVLRCLADLFGSRRVLLALQETARDRAFLWQAVPASGNGQDVKVSLAELQDGQKDTYFFNAPGQRWYAVRLRRSQRGEPFRLLALDQAGGRLRDVPCCFPGSFFAQYSFRSLLAVAFDLDGEWEGRLFLLDPRHSLEREADLRFLQALVREVGPALYGVHVVGRLRSRARAAERSRIARELHDEVVQSLIGAEMRVELLRRRAAQVAPGIAEELGQVQKLLRQEVIEVRSMMQHLRSLEIRPEELLAAVQDIVERFGRETGIAVRWAAELERVALPPRVCGELARIVQEALVNVRKHSGAQHVSVRFSSERGLCRVVVEDDGRGFEFAGRLSQAELERLRQGPRLLQERVKLIRGELAIESMPGRGARLEVCVPQKS